MRGLGREHYTVARLDVGYRCPPEVAAFARSLVDAAPSQPPRDTEGRVAVAAFEGPQALAMRLAAEIRTLWRRDPRASIAVVCRSPLFARFLTGALQREQVLARLVFDGSFLARGPVQVTTVEETKGLEFDVVIVPDATATDYPDTPASRRALYVAVTRARHQVLLAHAGKQTPLAPRSSGQSDR